MRERGYTGAYTAVKRFVAAIRPSDGPKPFEIRFETPPGHQAQVDFARFVTVFEDEAGIEPSHGSVGDSYDNALAETINGLYKAERIHRRGPWRSFEAVEFATLTWVDWFNNRRLLEPIGNIPPAEAEERYCAMLDEPAMAA